MKLARCRIVSISVLCIILAPFAIAEEIQVAKVYRNYPGYMETPTSTKPRIKTGAENYVSGQSTTNGLASTGRTGKVYRNYPGYIESPTCINPRMQFFDEEQIAENTPNDQPEAENTTIEQAEQKVIAAEKAAAERLEAERIAALKAEQEKLEKARLAAQQAEKARIEAEKAEVERIAALKAEQERLKQEKLEEQKTAAQQAEKARIEAEKAEVERIAVLKAEQEQLEQERLAAKEAERIAAEKTAAERLEAEKVAAQKAEAEKVAAQKAEAEKVAAQKAEAEKVAAQKAEAEKVAAQKAEAEKVAAQKAEAEKVAAQKAEAEKVAAQKAEAEKVAAQKAEAEKVAAQKAEAEKVAVADSDIDDQNKVDIKVASGQATIESSGPIDRFNHFTLDNPSRLVVDVYDQKPAFNETYFEADVGIEEVRVGTYNNKVRFVFDASDTDLPEYSITEDNDRILVSWQQPAAANAVAKVSDADNNATEETGSRGTNTAQKSAQETLTARDAESSRINVEEASTLQSQQEQLVAMKEKAEIKTAKEAEGQQFTDAATEALEQLEIRLSSHFPSFVATLQQSDMALLGYLVEQLKTQKLSKIEVVGHSDSLPIAARSRHIFADNRALSKARASNVAEYIQQQLGVPSESISLRGLGASMPLADNTTEAGRAKNRRVEIALVTEPVDNPDRLELVKEISAESGIYVSTITPNN